MIRTYFTNMNKPNSGLIEFELPYPIQVGEQVELHGEEFEVKTVTWVLEPGKSVELFVRLR